MQIVPAICFLRKGGCLIENGKLTQPVKDINIIGNGESVGRHYNGRETIIKWITAHGLCGKGRIILSGDLQYTVRFG